MANLIKCLTSISPDLRSSPSPGRRLLALVLCAMLAFGSVMPGLALAGETDSEGEGTSPTVELPLPPDFDPGGEETGLVEAPASEGEEAEAVELEPEAATDVPAGEVTSAATEAPVEAQGPAPVAVPEPTTTSPESEPIQQAQEPASSEPVANQSIVAPKQKPAEQRAASSGASSNEAAAPASEPPAEEAPPPSSPQPGTTPPADHGRHLAGKDSYVVRPGDCLWHIAAALLPAGADTEAIEGEVRRLWVLNEDRIGTGDPSLIYAGTTLRLH